MTFITRRVFSGALVALATAWTPSAAQQAPAGQPVFRSSADVVSVTAVVRDRKGQVVRSLTREQFEVVDAGQKRQILDLSADASSPASIALLIDGSGSMRLGDAHNFSRAIADAVLSSLDPQRDDAALMSFDSRLLILQDFTSDFDSIRDSLRDVEAFGTTSLYDAIAGTAGIVGERTKNRRAIVVLTDGADNASEYNADDVALIASSIDVPIYVFSLAPGGTPAPNDVVTPRRRSTLAELAHATGGEFYVADSQRMVVLGIAKLVEELRHQYLISFEASAFRGLRRIEIRTRRPELRVRARGWYHGRAVE